MPSLPKITLRYNGLFDFDGMYAAAIDWAKNYGYAWYEGTYKHKVPSPSGAEQEMGWEMTKDVNEYVAFKLILKIHVWDLTEVEVDVGGKKRKLSNARIDIQIKSNVIFNRQEIGVKGGRFSKWLAGKYHTWTSGNQDAYQDQLYYRSWNLHALLKRYFDMQTKKYAYKGYLGED